MSMKSKTALLGMLSAGAMFDPENRMAYPNSNKSEFKPETKEEIEAKQDKYYANKKLLSFMYGDKKIWALNKKNADRKAKNLGLL